MILIRTVLAQLESVNRTVPAQLERVNAFFVSLNLKFFSTRSPVPNLNLKNKSRLGTRIVDILG